MIRFWPGRTIKSISYFKDSVRYDIMVTRDRVYRFTYETSFLDKKDTASVAFRLILARNIKEWRSVARVIS